LRFPAAYQLMRARRMRTPFLSKHEKTMITTHRLELVPATDELLASALKGRRALGERLHASVPNGWPPRFLDDAALEYTRARLAQGPQHRLWWMHFIILFRAPAGRSLIGSAGYKGPPTPEGTVEIGYGIVEEYQRSGFATEAARGLIDHAFAVPQVQRVVAETLPDLEGSIGVLRKCGFHEEGTGSEPGVIRFELTRAEYARQSLLSHHEVHRRAHGREESR
jgi:ribosomal-protein-alanine N-acetyltransferase